MLLTNTAQTVLLVLGAVLFLAGLLGKALEAGGVHVHAPTSPVGRCFTMLVGIAVFGLAAINPVVHRFTVRGVTLDVAPTHYRGACPVGIELVGILHSKNGSGKVTSALYVESVPGRGVREVRMEDGDTVQRTIVVQKSLMTNAWYVVLSPHKTETSYPVAVTCVPPIHQIHR